MEGKEKKGKQAQQAAKKNKKVTPQPWTFHLTCFVYTFEDLALSRGPSRFDDATAATKVARLRIFFR